MHPSAPAPVRAPPPSHDDRTPQGSAAQGQNAGHHPLTNRCYPTPPVVEGGSGQRRVPSSDKLKINRCTKQRAPLRSGDVGLSVARSFAPCSIRRPPGESARRGAVVTAPYLQAPSCAVSPSHTDTARTCPIGKSVFATRIRGLRGCFGGASRHIAVDEEGPPVGGGMRLAS